MQEDMARIAAAAGAPSNAKRASMRSWEFPGKRLAVRSRSILRGKYRLRHVHTLCLHTLAPLLSFSSRSELAPPIPEPFNPQMFPGSAFPFCAVVQLAKKFHPDANKSDPGAEKKFQEVQQAYEVCPL